MELQCDKVLGSWFGMAVGDAMGLSVRGLKQETIAQFFGGIDGYKDVTPHIGAGVKRYRMQGLYGVQTQSALAVCDSILKNKNAGGDEITSLLQEMSSMGPEHYCGVFRHALGTFRKMLESLEGETSLAPVGHNFADGSFFAMTVPLALIYRDDLITMRSRCVEIYSSMTANLCELNGALVLGFFITRFLAMSPNEEGAPADPERLLEDAAKFCEDNEAYFQETFPDLWEENGGDRSFSHTLRGLRDNFKMDASQLKEWICQNASTLVKSAISHPSQGYALTLLPLALMIVLREGKDFASAMTPALNMGREADRMGALVGAMAGALYGFSGISDAWRSGLVNAREIKLRGEALFSGKGVAAFKDLQAMESGLTAKENETGKKYLPKTSKKSPAKGLGVKTALEGNADDLDVPRKEDVVGWRKYNKDKTKEKRDRRRNRDLPEL